MRSWLLALGFSMAGIGSGGCDSDGAPAYESPDTAATENVDDEVSGGDGTETETEQGAAIPAEPIAPFESVAMYETTLASNGDPADVYYPNPVDLGTGDYSFPVALMLQGALVDKKHYKGFAEIVAGYGYVVVIPNHKSKVMAGMGKFVDQSVIPAALEHMRAENDNQDAPVRGVIDAERLILFGHSHGGMCGISAILGSCTVPCCAGGFQRPHEIAAGVFWGTGAATAGKIGNEGIPMALIQGTKDGMNQPAGARATYDKIAFPPKAYIKVKGANHYGQCDVNNPPGALRDSSKPDIDQEMSVDVVGRWTGLFLDAHIGGNPMALAFVHQGGDAGEELVEVIDELP